MLGSCQDHGAHRGPLARGPTRSSPEPVVSVEVQSLTTDCSAARLDRGGRIP